MMSIALPSGQHAYPSEICDDKCDVVFCEDEAMCNGYIYGVICVMNSMYIKYVPPVLDRERFSDRDREREREWQKVPGTGINRERE